MIYRVFFVLFVAQLALYSCSNPSDPSFEADTTIEGDFEYNFGEVMAGEVVKARFEIKNTGDAPLQILNAKASCGCTVADHTKEAVEPGGIAWVEADVNTTGMNGLIQKSVTISTNTQPTSTTLLISGKVL